MRDLKLKYYLELVSNIGKRAAEDAKLMEKAQQDIEKSTEKTSETMKRQEKQVVKTGTSLAQFQEQTVKAGGNLTKLQAQITGTTSKFVELDRAMGRLGNNTGSQRQITFVNMLKDKLDSAVRGAGRLQESLSRVANTVANTRVDPTDVAAAGYGAKRAVAPFLKSYSSLEDAETGLKIAMMTKGGQVGGDYDAIRKIAVAQGNKLPGSTKDMTQAATELIALGITPQAVKGGGLVASTNLGVVLGIDQRQAAATTAKLREAYSLKDDELPTMADVVQRNRYAGGMAPEELLMAAKYEAPVINALHMGGLGGMNDVLTVQGMANQKGMNGGEFGTNFSEMLSRLAVGPMMVEQAKKGMKGDVRERLDALGIKFDFFDSNGQVKTRDGSAIKGIFAELEKFNRIKNKDGTSDDKTKLEVAKALFGSEGGRPALIMAQAGLHGFEEARARVEGQASLDERINVKLETFASKLESLGGTIENVMAHMGAQLGGLAKPVMDGANSFLGGGVDDFMQAHPTAGTVGIGAGATGAALLALKSKALLFRLLGMGGAAAAEGAAGAGAAGGAGAAAGTLSLGMLGAGAAGLFAGSQLWRLGSAFSDLSEAQNREGVQLSPYAKARLAALQQGNLDTAMGAAGVGSAGLPGLDFMTLTAPGATPAQLAPGRSTDIKIGEGVLRLDVHVTSDGATAIPSVVQQPSLIRINPGATHPGGMR